MPIRSRRSPAAPMRSDGGGCLGLHQLSRRGLEMARRLAEWREDEARRQNRPLRQTMRDDVLVAIAKRQPSSRRDLEALRDFNRPSLVSRTPSILAVLEAARAVPEERLPEHLQRPDDSPGASTVASLLSAALGQLCVQNKVAASLVANVVRPQALDPMVPRWPAPARSPRLARGLAWRALRPSAAGSARRPENLSRCGPGQ